MEMRQSNEKNDCYDNLFFGDFYLVAHLITQSRQIKGMKRLFSQLRRFPFFSGFGVRPMTWIDNWIDDWIDDGLLTGSVTGLITCII